MKKRFSAVLLSLIMAFTLLPAGAKAAQTVTLGAQDGRAVTGDGFEWAEFPVTASGFSEALTIDNTELSVMMYTDAAGTKGEASAADKGFSVSYYIVPLMLNYQPLPEEAESCHMPRVIPLCASSSTV